MIHFKQSVNHFIVEEAGYDLVEFAMAGGLAASVAAVAFKSHMHEIGSTVHAILHN